MQPLSKFVSLFYLSLAISCIIHATEATIIPDAVYEELVAIRSYLDRPSLTLPKGPGSNVDRPPKTPSPPVGPTPVTPARDPNQPHLSTPPSPKGPTPITPARDPNHPSVAELQSAYSTSF